MENFILTQVGIIRVNDDRMCIELDKQYAKALNGLDGFSHIHVLWWFNKCDHAEMRSSVEEENPYKKGPAVLGTFATRSPLRPNPIALSCAQITYIDHENAIIGLAYIDAEDGTPVLDIKPYTPSLDRVLNPGVPEWCAHWPQNCEASGDFDWENEFNF